MSVFILNHIRRLEPKTPMRVRSQFNITMRQCISRLVRETLAFPTKLAHRALTYYMCDSNLTRAKYSLFSTTRMRAS